MKVLKNFYHILNNYEHIVSASISILYLLNFLIYKIVKLNETLIIDIEPARDN